MEFKINRISSCKASDHCICDDYDDRVILIIVQVLINYIPVTCVSKIKINLWRGFWSTRRRVLALAGHGEMSHHHNLLLTSSSWFMMSTAMMILKRLMIVALMKDRGCQRHGVVVCHLHRHLLKTFATINTTNCKTKEKTKTTNVFSATALFIPESFKRIDCSCWVSSVEWLWNWILTQSTFSYLFDIVTLDFNTVHLFPAKAWSNTSTHWYLRFWDQIGSALCRLANLS